MSNQVILFPQNSERIVYTGVSEFEIFNLDKLHIKFRYGTNVVCSSGIPFIYTTENKG